MVLAAGFLCLRRFAVTIQSMPTYIDLDTWPRREVFEFYRSFDKPFFNVCVQLEVTNLLNELRRHAGVSVALTYPYFALKAANEIEQFRYRLRTAGCWFMTSSTAAPRS